MSSSNPLPNHFVVKHPRFFFRKKKPSPEALETRSAEIKRLSLSLGCRRDSSGGELGTANEVLVELTGIEPVTPCLQSRCSPS
jgi:hypothetical protein